MKKRRVKNFILYANTFIALNAATISFLSIFLNKNPYKSGAVCLLALAWIALFVYANRDGDLNE